MYQLTREKCSLQTFAGSYFCTFRRWRLLSTKQPSQTAPWCIYMHSKKLMQKRKFTILKRFITIICFAECILRVWVVLATIAGWASRLMNWYSLSDVKAGHERDASLHTAQVLETSAVTGTSDKTSITSCQVGFQILIAIYLLFHFCLFCTCTSLRNLHRTLYTRTQAKVKKKRAQNDNFLIPVLYVTDQSQELLWNPVQYIVNSAPGIGLCGLGFKSYSDTMWF